MFRRRLGPRIADFIDDVIAGAGLGSTSLTSRTRVGTNEAEMGTASHPMQLHVETAELSCSFTVHLSADNLESLAALLQAVASATYDATGSPLNLRPGDAAVECLNLKGEATPVTSDYQCRKLLRDSPDAAGIRIVEVRSEPSSEGPPGAMEEARPARGRGRMPVASDDLD